MVPLSKEDNILIKVCMNVKVTTLGSL